MKARLALAAVSAIALAAAACSPKPADPAATTEAGVAPASAPVTGNAEPEGPAPGNWKLTVNSMGQDMPPQEVCIKEQLTMADGQKMQEQAGMTCSEQTWNKVGGDTVGHSVCSMEMGGNKVNITSDIRVSGDMKTAYTMESKSKMDPPPMPNMAETTTTIKAERLGDCDASTPTP